MQRNDEGILEFDLNDEADFAEAYKELLETETGQRYLAECQVSEKDSSRILVAAMTLFSLSEENPYGTVAQLEVALNKLMVSGKVRPIARQQATPLPVPAPVDATPKLTGSQQAWHEFRVWSDTHSSSECKLRARSGDQAYADFYRLNLTREFAEQKVGDAVEAAGSSQVSRSTQISGPLVEFARLYAIEPAQNLKPKGGMVTLGERQLSWEQFNQQLEAAVAAGVIR